MCSACVLVLRIHDDADDGTVFVLIVIITMICVYWFNHSLTVCPRLVRSNPNVVIVLNKCCVIIRNRNT